MLLQRQPLSQLSYPGVAGSEGIEPPKPAPKTGGLPLTELPADGVAGGNRTLVDWFTASRLNPLGYGHRNAGLRACEKRYMFIATRSDSQARKPALLVLEAALASASAGLQPAATLSQLLQRNWSRRSELHRRTRAYETRAGAAPVYAASNSGPGSGT